MDFIRFLSPRRLFLKPQSVRKKLHAELLEQLKSRAPEIEVVSQKRFQLPLSGRPTAAGP
ncbi:hypothetical protein [Corallococcus sp. 4LFB]|uniref:hypothetical protein n=1 Tax=Corallococcus sp. 4LFB TaxID=3383249 RepID=UPI0039771371